MDTSEIEIRYWAALGVAREAGRLAAEAYHRRGELDIERKGTQDLVSEADRACEDKIVGALQQLFPEDGFLGEERGAKNPGAKAIWIIDPIDGTANFLRGIPLWCVSLGLLADGEFVIGVIYNPVTEELYAARRGKGATLNGRKIEVSKTRSLEEARLCIGFSYRRPAAPHAEAVKALLEAHCEYSRLGSGALGLAFTADGRLDGYWEAHINAWDVAAGLCIVKEAGGRMNDFLSGDGLNKGNEVLVSNPHLYAPLSALVKIKS
ncbi:inositol monophosphatase [Nordella sp. HKS 07]|uniref:inositol monophosphatase family protein n=1 Tax=Nordella sp. HKS 07 TaxID=2712222 RepID=UPI0013E14620|nr:inositol monophosphatase family protein [Nordella sp. HKS 07]QIG49688.1 inositol monophosphatase [Nordella sp. HKS 07]